MREIKFRGRSFDNGEWIYGDYHKRAGGVHCIIKMEPDENGKVVYVVHQVVPDTIGQFTGLYDENGEEIYEGDIVERFQPMPHYTNGVYYDGCAIYGVVRYIDAGFYILCENQAYELSRNFDMWVQGNIHDNPELLNK